ncbi:hypothetical protein A9Q86_10640 [Flavobacteriales bacterium 33_180_T64]|nr:hypothetical protein A9Q86_10640 [Flavobacteriales bacterium 33_180_T64]
MKSFQLFLKSIVIVLSLLLCFSCETDDSPSTTQNQNLNPDPAAFAQNFGNEISRTFLGTVVDTNNTPIENVTISIGNTIAMTDSNGVFIINDATVNERFGYIKAEKTGYIHASRAVTPSSGTNKVRIMMLPETIVGTTSSGMQETISLPNNASVALEGDYIKPDGSDYSGNVNVIMHHLDPANENTQDQMPGMLYAANAQNEERMLQTFGMLAIELRGDNGEDLNLAEGSTAEITVPLDASLMTNAPSTIPLWYFDEINGYWVEQGQATLVGDTYIGTVSHFSFWNCDIPTEYVNLCVTVNDSDGNPIANVQVSLTSTNYGTGNGYTNENGETCGIIPSNETLEVNVYNYDVCGQSSLYTDTIGPFIADSSISITITDNSDIISETVTGLFNDCNGNPVADGYVHLEYGNQVFVDAVENGEFEINLIRCDTENTFSITGNDYGNLQTTDSINYTFTTPLTNIGTITACNTVLEFIQYTIDNDSTQIFFAPFETDLTIAGPNLDSDSLNIYSQNDINCFYFFGLLNDAPYLGEYDYYEWNGQTGDNSGFTISECTDISDTSNNNILFNLTTFGNPGEYIDINFSGDYEDYDGNPHSITGSIHVLRDN